MSFDVYFVTADLKKTRSTLIDERRILETLGHSNEAVASHLKETVSGHHLSRETNPADSR